MKASDLAKLLSAMPPDADVMVNDGEFLLNLVAARCVMMTTAIVQYDGITLDEDAKAAAQPVLWLIAKKWGDDAA